MKASPSWNSKVTRQFPLTQIDPLSLSEPFNGCQLKPGISMSLILVAVSNAKSCMLNCFEYGDWMLAIEAVS